MVHRSSINVMVGNFPHTKRRQIVGGRETVSPRGENDAEKLSPRQSREVRTLLIKNYTNNHTK